MEQIIEQIKDLLEDQNNPSDRYKFICSLMGELDTMKNPIKSSLMEFLSLTKLKESKYIIVEQTRFQVDVQSPQAVKIKQLKAQIKELETQAKSLDMGSYSTIKTIRENKKTEAKDPVSNDYDSYFF